MAPVASKGQRQDEIKHPEGSIRVIAFGMPDFEDFSVVVKNRAQPPKPWRWEIYRAGRRSPVSYSAVYFETLTEAKLAGKKALHLFLSEYQVEYPPPAK